FDRCLGYVLPHFELVKGQSHHKKRYEEDKPYTFIFYGHDISEEDKNDAIRYVNAVCTNMRTHVKDVQFIEEDEEPSQRTITKDKQSDKTVLLNASMRSVNGNSARLARELQKMLKGETEIINLSQYLKTHEELMKILSNVSKIVLCMPLYVDGLPSQLIRLMERMEKEYKGTEKKIYVLTNMGLYESEQLINLHTAVRKWCSIMDFEYAGGLAVAAGELVGAFLEMSSIERWPLQDINEGMKKLADAIDNDRSIEDIYRGVKMFPRFLYILIANSGWARMGRKNGLKKKDLFVRL
ncbi:MAG: hypothetical protein J6Z03_03600, partial [Erysipelotrichaceae bacterium]|nr:hypothetical protein [Erysipelotrichaceae bacterium]